MGRHVPGDRLVRLSIKVPCGYVMAMDRLVRAGLFPSRSEVAREALRRMLSEYAEVVPCTAVDEVKKRLIEIEVEAGDTR